MSNLLFTSFAKHTLGSGWKSHQLKNAKPETNAWEFCQEGNVMPLRQVVCCSTDTSESQITKPMWLSAPPNSTAALSNFLLVTSRNPVSSN